MTARLVLSCSVLLLACVSSVPVALPRAVRDRAERYTVGGHITLLQPKLVFGPYTVKGSTYGSGFHSDATMFNGGIEKVQDRKAGKFALPTPSGMFRGRCQRAAASQIEHELRIENVFRWRDYAHVVASASLFVCAIGQPQAAGLRLERRDADDGTIDGAELHWTFVPIAALAARPPIASGLHSGFAILEGSTVLGIVDARYEASTVTFARELVAQRRDQFAAVAAALLLLSDL